jgi:imidazole glycerol phosphate synthase, glutamine amidotransferase subunit
MAKTIAIVDYGVGNLRSVQNALAYIGQQSLVTADAVQLEQADGIILPGVGAFADAAESLQRSGLVDTIKAELERKPLLGICLGMQLLFDGSQEGRSVPGLGLIPGMVERIQTEEKLPQIGWNALEIKGEAKLFQGIDQDAYVYFVHSYHCVPQDKAALVVQCDYGTPVCAAVQQGNCFGTQFHPEKSGEIGLQILKNFGALL